MHYKKFEYDYECGIEMFTVCNYHCEYCSGPRVKKSLRRGRTKEDADTVIRFFQQTEKTWLLGLSGGEPTIHPHFYHFVNSLKSDHFFYMFSNLSFDVTQFMNSVPADRVQYLKLSLHPKGDMDLFFENFSTLHRNGYNPVAIMVSAPGEFDRAKHLAEFCGKNEFPFTFSVMEGPYRGKNYPAEYTETERRFVESYTLEPGNLIRLISKTSGGMNTFNLSCDAGSSSFVLDMETGVIQRCESDKTVFGNVYEGTFAPNTRAANCPVINGCVGYDRNMMVPSNYRQFFVFKNNVYQPLEVKAMNGYPAALVAALQADGKGATSRIKAALQRISDTLNGRNTLLWGGGIYGAKILYHLRNEFGDDKMKHITGFVDSLKDRQKEVILGLPVYAPSSDAVRDAQIIMTTSYAYEADILKTLEKMNIKGEVIALHRDLLKPMGVETSMF
ncbi:MAG: radical SAM protein [Deltaproteobacteria bacterium]|nr:radical SAM protein [Deltaproteobacteria bacterium]MBN2674611.1 radical SAM protein [Deltaproteobacteria bacterium]